MRRMVAVVAALAAAGCSSGADDPPPLPTLQPPADAAPTSPGLSTASAVPSDPSVAWEAPPPRGPTEAGVLLAYRDYWTVAQRLFRDPDPADPEIARVAVGPARDQLVRLLRNAVRARIRDRGVVVFRPSVTAVSGTEAVIEDCIDSTRQADYDPAGRLIPNSNGRRFRVHVDLVRAPAGDRWVVFSRREVSGAC